MKKDLSRVLIVLPTDYQEYGGNIKRWEDSQKDYPDCSRGCKHFVPLDGDLRYDWGVCTNLNSPRKGLLTWEHQAGIDCFEPEEEEKNEKIFGA